MKYNGWLGFVAFTVLFFAAPPLYRFIDPTAGQFDAGYIHPIIYASAVLTWASGLAFFLLQITAPAIHAQLDRFLESEEWVMTDAIRYGMIMYLVFMILMCATVWSAI